MQNGEKASKEYIYNVKGKAGKKTSRALKDLAFLADVYPEAIDAELLLNAFESYMNQEAFTVTKEERETIRLPPSMGRSRPPVGAKWVNTGALREGSGAPLKKKLGKKAYVSYRLLSIIYRSIMESTIMGVSKEGEAEPIIILSQNPDSTMNMQLSSLLYPRMITGQKITLADAVEEMKPESESIVLWHVNLITNKKSSKDRG
jgi:hypothetical protein